MTSDFIAVSKLLSQGRPAAYPVAQGRRGPLTWDDLRRSVGGLVQELRRSDRESWLIATEDAFDLAVALLAILHAGKRALLPATLQPGHLAELAPAAGGVLLGERVDGPSEGSLKIADIRGEGEEPLFEPLDPEAGEILLHTSGSTGRPEAVAKSLRCLEAEVAVLEQVYGGLAAQSVLATVPAYHIYGLLFRVLWPLAAGRAFEVGSLAYPEELELLSVQRQRPFLISSPAFLRRALPMLNFQRIGQELCGVFSSGGPLLPEVASAYNQALSCDLYEIYGSTETGGIAQRVVRNVTVLTPWQTFPGVEVAYAADGCALSVRSPYLPSGAVYDTGDRGRILGEGRFVLEGRKDRIVKLEERRVSLVEIEERLKACPEIEDLRVVVLQDAGARAQLGAVVVLSAPGWQVLRDRGKQALKGLLQAALKHHVEALALPRRWRFVRRLPESAQGKVLHDSLLALFQTAGNRKVEPQVVERALQDGSAEIRLTLVEDLVFFDGHFDAAAILPGVVQLDWAVRYARLCFPVSGECNRVEALKFFQVLPAGTRVDLCLEFDSAKSSVNFTYRAGEVTHSSGRLRFGARQ